MADLLARPCDACGKPIGGGYKHFPSCNIYLHLDCSLDLQKMTKKYQAKCSICGHEF